MTDFNFITPAYYFNLDEFRNRANYVKDYLGNISLTYSIKANPFLLEKLPDSLSYVEVCSPGELQICKSKKISGEKIIYSGVHKEHEDILDALEYGVNIATIESLRHAELLQNTAKELGIKQKVILRVTSGNQFGMDFADIFNLLDNREKYSNLNFYGFHYYSGTQKKLRQLEKDFQLLDELMNQVREKYDYVPAILEYGPGLSVNYFSETYKAEEENNLNDLCNLLKTYSVKMPIAIEMGRFLASTCGTYATKVVDIKKNNEVNYVICDGGIHHIKYYGQTMSMKIPEIEVYHSESIAQDSYCLCGSLCTVADVLVREVELPKLHINDILLFKRCGAYSVTENAVMFLSRNMPNIYLVEGKNIELLRDAIETWKFNGYL